MSWGDHDRVRIRERRPRCGCTGSAGAPKTSYASREDAHLAALRRGWVPFPYPCPSGTGWHLTHPSRARPLRRR